MSDHYTFSQAETLCKEFLAKVNTNVSVELRAVYAQAALAAAHLAQAAADKN